MIIEFFITNWLDVLFVVSAVIALIVLYRLGKRTWIMQMAYELVIKAEQQYGSGTGELKFNMVSTWLYEKLPTIAKWLFTEKTLDKYIQSAVEFMKDYFNKNEEALKLLPNNPDRI